MANILVVYHSQTGHTGRMAQAVAEGARLAGGHVTVKTVQEAPARELASYDALIVGTPTYYGLMSAPLKAFFDESVALHGKLTGKVGGAFTSSGCIGGGNETAVLSVLQAMLIHGMVVQGTAQAGHYGPVAIGDPDKRAEGECRELGRRVAELAARLFG